MLISFAVDMDSELGLPMWEIALWFPILYLGFGLTALGASILLAPFLFFWKCPSRRLGDPLVAPAAAFATCLCIFMADSLFNAFYNPVLMVAVGGLSSLLMSPAAFASTGAAEDLTALPEHSLPATRVI